MPTETFDYRSEAERLAIERAIAFVAEMRALAQTAPDGQILPAGEAHALDAGRDLLRSTLQQAAQARIDAAERKKGRRVSVPEPAPSASSGAAEKCCLPSAPSRSNALTAIAETAGNPRSPPTACGASRVGFPHHVGPFVEFMVMADSPERSDFWMAMAA